MEQTTNKSWEEYSTVEREALAAVSIIKEFYPYLNGFTFKLITDHNPLTSLQALKMWMVIYLGG